MLRSTLPRLETAVLVLAVSVLVFVGYERSRPQAPALQVESYSTYDAAGGGYRAAYDLLEREGVRVERFERRPAFLDRSIDTLAYVAPLPFDPREQAPTQADVRALEGWVRAGGHLFFVGSDDTVRGALGLPASRFAFSRTRRPFVAADLRARGITHIASSSPRRWKTAGGRVRVLIADARGPLVIAYPYGRGHVVAAIDPRFFANDGIATGDRARLAVALVTPAHAGSTVAFDEAPHGFVTPEHWWSIVPRPFALALGLAGIACLIALGGAAIRLGPPLVPRVRDDRTTADFIDALAGLFERNAALRGTLGDAATSTSRVIARALGLAPEATSDEIAARIGRDDLRAAFVEMLAVAETRAASDRNLVRGVALAQRLRKEYTAHGRSRN